MTPEHMFLNLLEKSQWLNLVTDIDRFCHRSGDSFVIFVEIPTLSRIVESLPPATAPPR